MPKTLFAQRLGPDVRESSSLPRHPPTPALSWGGQATSAAPQQRGAPWAERQESQRSTVRSG
eukprot:4116735-Pyramimonas_sp.AAC.1